MYMSDFSTNFQNVAKTSFIQILKRAFIFVHTIQTMFRGFHKNEYNSRRYANNEKCIIFRAYLNITAYCSCPHWNVTET
jgi:hypothetical protein